jgi:predicted RNase H-like HicB family nuclease
MRSQFTASLWREGEWVVAQCVEIDVASQGHNEDEALENLKDALILYAKEPTATIKPTLRTLEVELVAQAGGV